MANRKLRIAGAVPLDIRVIDLGDGSFALATTSVPSGSDTGSSIGISGTVSVLTTSTQLAPANTLRTSILISNKDATKSIRIAFGSAATLTDFELIADADLVVSTTQSINAITATGTVSVDILEEVRS